MASYILVSSVQNGWGTQWNFSCGDLIGAISQRLNGYNCDNNLDEMILMEENFAKFSTFPILIDDKGPRNNQLTVPESLPP